MKTVKCVPGGKSKSPVPHMVTPSQDVAVVRGHGNVSFAHVFKYFGLKTLVCFKCLLCKYPPKHSNLRLKLKQTAEK